MISPAHDAIIVPAGFNFHSVRLVFIPRRLRLQPRAAAIGLTDAASGDFVFEAADCLVDGHGAQVPFPAVADADAAALGVARANDEHVGNVLELAVADFGA